MTTKEISPILTVTDFEKDDPEYQLMKDFYKLFKVLYQVKTIHYLQRKQPVL